MNSIQIIGNLTRDPEVRHTTSGLAVCNFAVAVNRDYVNSQTGQREADYFNVVVWRELGETCARHLAKGRKVAVIGQMQMRVYQAQDGSNRTAWELVANRVYFLTPNPQNNAQANATAQATAALPHTNTPGARATFSNTVVAGPAQMMTAPDYDAGMPPADTGFTQVDDDELPF